jgi:hypothetical protein
MTEIEMVLKRHEDKIMYYRVSWFLFMVLMVGPAWYLASTVEGVSFFQAVEIVKEGLYSLYFPGFLVSLAAYPVTVLATLIPGSGAIVLTVVALVFSVGSFFIAFVYFALVQPPNYKAMKAKYDPNWETKENAHIVVKPLARPVAFSGFIGFLLLTSVIGEFFFGYHRTPMADDYKGAVFLVDRNQKKIPMDVTVKVAVIDPGRVFDRKPGVSERSLHIEFSGKDLDVLKKLGIDDRLFAGNAGDLSYSQTTCSASQGTTQKNVPGYLPGTFLLRSDHIKNLNYDANSVKCPESMHFGMEGYDEAQFAITDISKGYIVVAALERDSRISWIQRMIMHHRYETTSRDFFSTN